jgi:excinuclease UvrABC ATPase subunit
MILVMGVTGAGKSTFIQWVAQNFVSPNLGEENVNIPDADGKMIVSDDSMESVTKLNEDIQNPDVEVVVKAIEDNAYSIKLDNGELIGMFDFPGFGDTADTIGCSTNINIACNMGSRVDAFILLDDMDRGKIGVSNNVAELFMDLVSSCPPERVFVINPKTVTPDQIEKKKRDLLKATKFPYLKEMAERYGDNYLGINVAMPLEDLQNSKVKEILLKIMAEKTPIVTDAKKEFKALVKKTGGVVEASNNTKFSTIVDKQVKDVQAALMEQAQKFEELIKAGEARAEKQLIETKRQMEEINTIQQQSHAKEMAAVQSAQREREKPGFFVKLFSVIDHILPI